MALQNFSKALGRHATDRLLDDGLIGVVLSISDLPGPAAGLVRHET
jgi:hypothetical protein